jgi:hypothetical protein
MALIFLFYRLPETKNRNLSEVRREMHKLPRSPMQQLKKNRSITNMEMPVVTKGWNNVIVNNEREEKDGTKRIDK